MKPFSMRLGFFLVILTTVLMLCAEATAEELSFPTLTETDCEWDGNGNLIRETAHTPDGSPALNSRGFYQAVYTWDGQSNLLTEAYYDTEGKPAVIDRGYARAEYTYHQDANDHFHILTEDRYSADGSRADIPGEYSYRRDEWKGDQILSSRYYNAQGGLTRPNGGYAEILYSIDTESEPGRYIVTKRYLDADGSPLTGSEGGEMVISIYTVLEYLVREVHTEFLDWDMMLPENLRRGDQTEQLLLTRMIRNANGEKVLGSGRWCRQEKYL